MTVYDYVIGRKGDSLTGTVLDKVFEVFSSLGSVKIKTKDITWVHFKNPPQFKQDEIWLKNGDRLTGNVKKKIVRFKIHGGPEIRIKRENIHTLIINQKWNLRAKPLA